MTFRNYYVIINPYKELGGENLDKKVKQGVVRKFLLFVSIASFVASGLIAAGFINPAILALVALLVVLLISVLLIINSYLVRESKIPSIETLVVITVVISLIMIAVTAMMLSEVTTSFEKIILVIVGASGIAVLTIIAADAAVGVIEADKKLSGTQP